MLKCIESRTFPGSNAIPSPLKGPRKLKGSFAFYSESGTGSVFGDFTFNASCIGDRQVSDTETRLVETGLILAVPLSVAIVVLSVWLTSV